MAGDVYYTRLARPVPKEKKYYNRGENQDLVFFVLAYVCVWLCLKRSIVALGVLHVVSPCTFKTPATACPARSLG